ALRGSATLAWPGPRDGAVARPPREETVQENQRRGDGRGLAGFRGAAAVPVFPERGAAENNGVPHNYDSGAQATGSPDLAGLDQPRSPEHPALPAEPGSFDRRRAAYDRTSGPGNRRGVSRRAVQGEDARGLLPPEKRLSLLMTPISCAVREQRCLNGAL